MRGNENKQTLKTTLKCSIKTNEGKARVWLLVDVYYDKNNNYINQRSLSLTSLQNFARKTAVFSFCCSPKNVEQRSEAKTSLKTTRS